MLSNEWRWASYAHSEDIRNDSFLVLPWLRWIKPFKNNNNIAFALLSRYGATTWGSWLSTHSPMVGTFGMWILDFLYTNSINLSFSEMKLRFSCFFYDTFGFPFARFFRKKSIAETSMVSAIYFPAPGRKFTRQSVLPSCYLSFRCSPQAVKNSDRSDGSSA